MRIEKSAKTVEDAIELALLELKAKREMVNIEVLEEGNKGFFGFIGNKSAKVRVALKKEYCSDSDDESSCGCGCGHNQDDNEEGYGKNNAEDNGDDVYEECDEEGMEIAESFVNNVLDKMDVGANIETTFEKGNIVIRISGDNVGILIGRRGETLDALQYLTGLVVNKGLDRHTKVVVDVESYRSRREDTLVNLAQRLERKVLKTRKSVTLEPMTPYERRIIHSTLQDSRKVETYSIGEEPYRKIVIKPR